MKTTKLIKICNGILTLIVFLSTFIIIFIGANSPRFNSVYFIDSKKGWVVGTSILGDNKILYTTDGGLTWNKTNYTSIFLKSLYLINSSDGWSAGYKENILYGKIKSKPVKEQLEQIYFTDPNNGWILGYKGTIFSTTDGGVTWKEKNELRKVYEALNSNKQKGFIYFKGLQFVDSKNGWVAGSKGTILYTKDGGITWYRKKDVTNKDLKKIYFTDNKNGWIAGYGTILHTKNGGLTWDKQKSGISSHLCDIYFQDPNNGWTAGNYTSIIMNTKDGGNKWEKQNIERNCQPSAIHFTDQKNGWAVGAGGTILHTANGGNAWNTQNSGTDADLYAVYAVDQRNAWAVGTDSIILHTKDGGLTWETQKSNNLLPTLGIWFFIIILYLCYSIYLMSRVRPLNIKFIDPKNGWATGHKGTLLNSKDGGISWNIIQGLPVKEPLIGLHFVDINNGWVVGDNGTILNTKDGGMSWYIQESYTCQNLNGVYFSDLNHGWITGDGNTILYTKHGGISWMNYQLEDNPNQILKILGIKNLNGVYFIDNNNGWIAGNGGKILHTQNGGDLWEEQKCGGVFNNIYGIHFIDSYNGWAVGQSGVYVTKDSGKNWLLQKKAYRIIGVHFTDYENGWASGGIGKILHTEDGGLIWTEQTSNSIEYLEMIHFIDLQNGWIIRADGKVLYTTNGGEKWEIARIYKK